MRGLVGRWKLQHRLVASYVALGALISLLTLGAISCVRARGDAARAERAPFGPAVMQLTSLIASASEEGFSYVVAGDAAERAQFEAKLTDARLAADALARGKLSDVERTDLDRIRAELGRLDVAGQSMFGSYARSQRVDATSYRAYESAVDEALRDVGALDEARIAWNLTAADEVRTTADRLTVGVGVLSLLFAWSVGSLLARRTATPLLALRDAARAFGQGRLDAPVDVSSPDEIGELGAAFVQMRQDVLHRRSLHHGTWTSSPLPMWIFDQDTFRFLDVNDAALALYGYSRDEMLSMTVADIRPPEDVARFREAAAEDVPGVRRAGVWTHRRKDGALLDVDVTAFHLVIDGRKVVCTMLRDVTHARRVESALAESEDRYRTLFEASPVAMWTWDVESHVFVTANAAACALYGYSRDEFLGMKIEDFALESDREALRERLRRGVGERVVGERTHVTRRGDVIRVQIAAQRVQIDGRTRMFTVVHDVTERRSLEAQLVQAQKMEAIGRMAGGIAHDFNNILAAILVNSDWIATELRESHPLYEDAVGISTAAQRGAALTRQLLTFSRKQPQELRRVELNAVISDTDRLLRRLLGEDVRLKCSLDPTLGPIMADPSQMEQVLLNLAINARDAMPMGGELRVVSRNVELADPRHGLAAGPYVTVSVSDTGCGMDAATQSRIFEPFFTTKEPGKGTGLGLSTVFGIVRQSGGAVVVESEPGRGSTFTVYLPRSESSEPAPRQVLGGRGVAARGRTVLVVEDEEELRKAVCRVLRTEGYGVIAARGAEEGSRILADAERSIDVVLTDVVMPDGNGIALAEQARRVRPTVPILLMSGHSERVVELEGRHSLLAKPFTPKELAAAILEVLEAA